MSVYPNPATDYIAVSNANGIDSVVIYNELGSVVANEQCCGENEMIVETAGFETGTYLVVVNGNQTKKLVIQ